MQRTTKFAAATLAVLTLAAVTAVSAFPGPGMGPGFGPMGGGPGTSGPRFAGGDMTAFAD